MPNRQLILGRNGFTFAPYAGYRFLYFRARQLAHSETSPPWVKRAAGAYRKLARCYRSIK